MSGSQPTEADFTVEVRADARAVKVTFNPTESEYSFACLDPSEWSQHGVLSADVRVRHVRTGDTGPYVAGDVLALAGRLADRALRRVNGLPLAGVSATGVAGELGGAPPLPPIEARASAMLGEATLSATATVVPFAFPPEWAAQKQELIRQHALLRQTIATARQEIALAEELLRDDASIAGIGHNQPPEEFASVEETVNDALAGSDAVLVENLVSIRAGARLLRGTLRAFGAMGLWLAEKADRSANAFADQAGKRTADAITIVGVVKALGGIATVVAAIVALVGGLFAMLGQVL